MQLVAKEIQSQGGQTLAFQMDVTSKESIQSVMEKITNQGKKIDILINNAGTTKWTPLFPGSIEDDTFEKRGLEVWDELMNLNLRGLWMIIQVIAEYMRIQHIKGSIINIFSTLEERRPITGASAACVVSKSAVIHLTRQLVQELSPHNIRINCIIPRMFATELTEKRLKICGDEIKKRISLGFVGEPEDHPILWLLVM